ncbi:hypothetical protein DPMN_103250 [Dreissena polymorpha]|uniref:Uncharacterized protein n=1 Tax=Dreissena polymorpha TaxID=45954 RepID=A0A9D4JZ08_DREPO|nr:hypothetical protein DPMN_103250 [Dreissena polymorpha]
MPFPRRKAGARIRVTKALEKKRQECKKLQEKHHELKKKYNTKMRAIKRMNKSTALRVQTAHLFSF